MPRWQIFLQCLFFPVFASGFLLPLSNHDRSSIIASSAVVVGNVTLNNEDQQPVFNSNALEESTNQSSFGSSSFSYSSRSSSSSFSRSSSIVMHNAMNEQHDLFIKSVDTNLTREVANHPAINITRAVKKIWIYTPQSNGTLILVPEDQLPMEYWVPVRQKMKYWPNRTIAVRVEDRFRSSEEQTIWEALKALSETLEGCLNFIEKPEDEANYLQFRKGKSCDSRIGFKGGRHVVKLSDGCLDPEELGAIQHEVLHALGFFHEHSRKDRDDFVEVNWPNVVPREKADFKKLRFKTFGLPYDYTSVMHYASDAYAIKEDVPTLKPKKPSVNITMMGQRIGLSRADIIRVKIPYKCDIPESVKSWLAFRQASRRTARRISDNGSMSEGDVEDSEEYEELPSNI